MDVEHRISSAYHPQTNGQRERDNRTLKEALSKVVNEDGDDWDLHIPGFLFAYHTSVHASTKCTPFEVMYGRRAKLPGDRPKKTFDSNEDPLPVNKDSLQVITELRKDIETAVAENIKIAQKRQKKKL